MIRERLYQKVGLLVKNQKPKTKVKGRVVYILETMFVIEVNGFIEAVESCIKKAVREHQYRKYKEIYEIDLDVLKRVMTMCTDFTNEMQKFVTSKAGSKKLQRLKKTDKQLFIGVFHDE